MPPAPRLEPTAATFASIPPLELADAQHHTINRMMRDEIPKFKILHYNIVLDVMYRWGWDIPQSVDRVYCHDGLFRSIESTVDFYNQHGHAMDMVNLYGRGLISTDPICIGDDDMVLQEIPGFTLEYDTDDTSIATNPMGTSDDDDEWDESSMDDVIASASIGAARALDFL